MNWTDSAESRRLIEDLSRDVVSATAPEEIPLFHELLQEYYKEPNPPARPPSHTDDPLGFGVEAGLLAAVTPAAMAIVTEVLTYFKDEVIKSAKEEGAASIRERIKAILYPAVVDGRGGATPEKERPVLEFSKEQLLAIQKIARREAKKRGLSDEKAAQLADSLVGRLALT